MLDLEAHRLELGSIGLFLEVILTCLLSLTETSLDIEGDVFVTDPCLDLPQLILVMRVGMLNRNSA